MNLRNEIARLHKELAKANGACADMAHELGGLLAQIEALERQRDEMQLRCEQLEAKLSAQ